MKIFILIVVLFSVLLVLSSCDPWPSVPDTYDPQFPIVPAATITAHTWTPAQEICLWVDYQISYLADDVDYWQSPDETWSLKTGDCEDYALLCMYIIHRDLGGWPELVSGYHGEVLHGWIRYEGRDYEPQSSADITGSPEYRALKTIPYGLSMWVSMNTHRVSMNRRVAP